mgnify:CR=1 FL=1
MSELAPHLLVEKRDHVTVVTMNRPEARNAFGMEMLARMADAWAAIDADEGCRVAVLTGAGGHFCAGSDLKEMSGKRADDAWAARFKADHDLHWRGLLRHYRLKKPLVAAVEGYAVAGGTEILQATDVRIAGASAVFGITEPRWALFPRTEHELAEAYSWLLAQDCPRLILGGGSNVLIDDQPFPGVVLFTTKLDRFEDLGSRRVHRLAAIDDDRAKALEQRAIPCASSNHDKTAL